MSKLLYPIKTLMFLYIGKVAEDELKNLENNQNVEIDESNRTRTNYLIITGYISSLELKDEATGTDFLETLKNKDLVYKKITELAYRIAFNSNVWILITSVLGRFTEWLQELDK